MKYSCLAILLLNSADAFAPSARVPLRARSPVKMGAVSVNNVVGLVPSTVKSVLPEDGAPTLKNAVGYQAWGWGVAGLVAPAWVTVNVLGAASPCASSVNMIRGACLAVSRE